MLASAAVRTNTSSSTHTHTHHITRITLPLHTHTHTHTRHTPQHTKHTLARGHAFCSHAFLPLVSCAHQHVPTPASLHRGQVLLLEHADWAPSLVQRLNTIYLLHHMYRSEPPTKNPFLYVFDRILKVRPERRCCRCGRPPALPLSARPGSTCCASSRRTSCMAAFRPPSSPRNTPDNTPATVTRALPLPRRLGASLGPDGAASRPALCPHTVREALCLADCQRGWQRGALGDSGGERRACWG